MPGDRGPAHEVSPGPSGGADSTGASGWAHGWGPGVAKLRGSWPLPSHLSPDLQALHPLGCLAAGAAPGWALLWPPSPFPHPQSLQAPGGPRGHLALHQSLGLRPGAVWPHPGDLLLKRRPPTAWHSAPPGCQPGHTTPCTLPGLTRIPRGSMPLPQDHPGGAASRLHPGSQPPHSTQRQSQRRTHPPPCPSAHWTQTSAGPFPGDTRDKRPGGHPFPPLFLSPACHGGKIHTT